MTDTQEQPQQPPVRSRGVITLAFGKQRYLEMAKSLARSLELHAPNVPRAVMTDSDDEELRSLFSHVVPYRTEYGTNVVPKFYLDRFTPFDETLFIDSDCLLVRSLDPFWEAFENQYYGVPGWRILGRGETDPYLDLPFVLEHLHLAGFSKFNGGTYYLKRSAETTHFFDTVRHLYSRADELRIVNFRHNGPPDEPIFSIAMELHGLRMTSMGDRGMLTPIQSTGPLRLDVLKGRCSFTKEGRSVHPDIIHFAGEYANSFAYVRESAKLKAHFAGESLPLVSLTKAYVGSRKWQWSRTARTWGRNVLDRFAGAKRLFTPTVTSAEAGRTIVAKSKDPAAAPSVAAVPLGSGRIEETNERPADSRATGAGEVAARGDGPGTVGDQRHTAPIAAAATAGGSSHAADSGRSGHVNNRGSRRNS